MDFVQTVERILQQVRHQDFHCPDGANQYLLGLIQVLFVEPTDISISTKFFNSSISFYEFPAFRSCQFVIAIGDHAHLPQFYPTKGTLRGTDITGVHDDYRFLPLVGQFRFQGVHSLKIFLVRFRVLDEITVETDPVHGTGDQEATFK